MRGCQFRGFRYSQYVSINCTLTPTSHHLLTTDVFRMLKKTAVIINASRGPVIREEDLIDALRTRKIAGAALDVFEHEPLPKTAH